MRIRGAIDKGRDGRPMMIEVAWRSLLRTWVSTTVLKCRNVSNETEVIFPAIVEMDQPLP